MAKSNSLQKKSLVVRALDSIERADRKSVV